MRNKKVLTEELKSFILKNYESHTNAQLAKELRVSMTMIRTWCYSIGLLRMQLEYWTEEQITFLKENYKTIGDKELAIIFNKKWKKEKTWSCKHIEKKRVYLQLKRTPEELKKIKEGNKKRGCWMDTTTWQTRGAFPIGEVRIWNNKGDSYKVIRTEKGYVYYSRWLYRDTFGAIPKGHVVTYRDGNRMNVVPGNLVTMPMAENVRRNRYKYPEEIRNLETILKQLNHTLK